MDTGHESEISKIRPTHRLIFFFSHIMTYFEGRKLLVGKIIFFWEDFWKI